MWRFSLLLFCALAVLTPTGACLAQRPFPRGARLTRQIAEQQHITRSMLDNERGIYFQGAVPRVDARGRVYFADLYAPLRYAERHAEALRRRKHTAHSCSRAIGRQPPNTRAATIISYRRTITITVRGGF
jgi:hypothetical protein